MNVTSKRGNKMEEELIKNKDLYINITDIFFRAPNHLEGLIEIFWYGYNYDKEVKEEHG